MYRIFIYFIKYIKNGFSNFTHYYINNKSINGHPIFKQNFTRQL